MIASVQLILLSGSSWPALASPTAIFGGGSDWPLEDTRGARDCWAEVVAGAVREAGWELDVSAWSLVPVSTTETCSMNSASVIDGAPNWHVMTDRWPNRGSAGVVRDWDLSVGRTASAEWVCVADGSACPALDLARMFQCVRTGADCVLAASQLDRYCGCMLVRRKWLQEIPESGFFDLREQFLGRLSAVGAKISSVVVARRSLGSRTRSSWLSSVEAWHAFSVARGGTVLQSKSGVYRRDGMCVVCPDAIVRGAVIDSSIVLGRATIQPDAVVARSIIAPGAVVRSGEVVVDQAFGFEYRAL